MRLRAEVAWRTVYGARAGRECLYALLSLPTAVVGAVAVVVTVLVGTLSAAVLIVATVLLVVLAFDRGLAAILRRLAGSLLRLPVARPDRSPRRRGVVALLAHFLADPVAWRAVACFALRLPVGAVQFTVGFLPWLYGALLLFYPVLAKVVGSPDRDAAGAERSYGYQLGHFALDTWPLALAVVSIGVLVLAAAPWLTHAVLGLDRWLLPKVLGPSETSLRIRELEDPDHTRSTKPPRPCARSSATSTTASRPNSCARDAPRAGRDPARQDRRHRPVSSSASLETTSRRSSSSSANWCGIHPPALDAGLEPALATLAARAPIPTTVRVDLPSRPPAAVETMLYFAATELLANAAKHSRAPACSIGITTDRDTLRLTVSDDGIGGASADGAGSGLRGLAERVRTLGGSLAVTSPPGGPTLITADVPAGDTTTEAEAPGQRDTSVRR